MNLRIYFITFFSLAIGITSAEKNGIWSSRDDIYIDDIEGSGGGRTEVKDDLESSGSGFGPDDEDGPGSGDSPIDTHQRIGNVPSSSGVPVPEIKPDVKTADKSEPKPEQVDTKGTRNEIENTVSINNNKNTFDTVHKNDQEPSNEVSIMNTKHEDRATSFFAQPGILAAVIGGCVVGLLCAILVVMFIVYRMRKKDEGSYALDEPKRSPTANPYTKTSSREFYA